MKKVLTLALVVCMLLSVIPMAVSAEAIVEPETIPANPITHVAPTAPETVAKTVYVGDDKTEEYTPDGTRDYPYKNLETAYAAAIDGATGDIKIVIMDDVYAMTSETKTIKTGARFMLSTYMGGTVYICGEYNQTKQRYAILDFVYQADLSKATLFTIGSDTVIYDLILTNTTTNGSGTWINAALYDLTMGRNITNGRVAADGTIEKYISITGSYWNNEHDDYLNTENDGVTISIYSGTYTDVYAAHRTNSKLTTSIDENITLNIYGGTINKVFGNSNSASNYTTDNCEITINMWGGTVNTEVNAYCTADTIYLYLWNGYIPKKADGTELTPKNFDNGSGAGENRFELAYVGVQNTEKFTVTPEQGDAYEAYSVRFVGVVDKLEYDEIGFKITGSNGEDYSFACKTVYSSIQGDGEDVSAAELGGNYIFAATVYNIPVGYDGAITFTVQPYTRVGETRTYGTAYDVTYNAGAHVSSVAVAAN